MAAFKHYVRFKDTPRVTAADGSDELCPKCFTPALKRFILQQIDIEGITPLGERIACTGCNIWIAPLKEYRTT